MESKKINQLATNLAPLSTDLTIVGDPITGVSKKITLSQIANLFAGSIDFYTNLAAFPATGSINIIYCAKDTQKLYLWSGSAYVEVFPSQAVLNTYQLLSEKGVSNGYASLDSLGKVPIAQLPSSIMEYKGTWSAATNTPTLANGTGDTGDLYICSSAGSVNFGAGAITFAVGDYVIYSGSIWQRSSGAVGTVTSVGLSSATSGVTIGSSPVTTSGTITLAIATATTSQNGLLSSTDWATFNGKESVLTFSSPLVRTTNTISIPAATTSVNGYLASADFTTFNNKQNAITLTTTGTSGASTLVGATLNIPNYGSALTGYVPYTGATQDVDLDTFKLNAQSLHIKGTAGNGHLGLKHQSASATASANEVSLFADSLGNLSWLNGNLYLSKFITSGNTAARSYTFPNATGTIALTSDLTGYITAVTATSPLSSSGGTTPNITIAQATTSANGYLSSTDWNTFNNKQATITLTTTGTSGAATLIGATLNIPNYGSALSGYLPLTGGTLTGTLNVGSTSTGYNVNVYSSSYGGNGLFQGFGTDGLLKLQLGALGVNEGFIYTGASNKITVYSGGAVTATFNSNQTTTFSGALSGTSASFSSTATATAFIPSGATVPTNGMYLSAANTLNFATNTTNRLTIASNGAATFTSSVKSTQYLIAPNGTNQLYNIVDSDATYAGSYVFQAGGGSAGFGGGIIAFGHSHATKAGWITAGISSNSSGKFTVNTQGLGGGTDVFVVQANGNVGIGTVIPDELLTLSANVPVLKLTSTNASGKAYQFFSNSDGNFYLRNATTSTNLMVVTNSNNVLIGTTTDSGYKLDVNGTGRFSGALTGTSATFSSTIAATSATFSQSANSFALKLLNNAGFPSIIDLSVTTATVAARNWAIFTNGTNWGDLEFRPSAANGGDPYTTGTIALRLASTGAATFSANVQIGSGISASGLSQLTIGNLLGYAALKLSIDATKYSWIAGAQYNVDNGFEITPSTAAGGSTFTTPVFKILNTGAATFSSSVTATQGLFTADTDTIRVGTSSANGGISSYRSMFFAIDADNDQTDRSFIWYTNGFGTGTTLMTLLESGALSLTGSVTATSFFESSDNRLKTLIQDNYQTKGIASITPKLYTKNGKVELGYYAQDFVGILDSAVSKGSDDMLSLSYREVHTAKIYALEQRIKELESKLN